jgi:hypothetical protein
MRPGGVVSSAPGDIRDQILSVSGYVFKPNTLYLRITVADSYRCKYYAVFVNGIYLGYNIYAPVKGDMEVTVPLTSGTTLGSFYIEDAGDWATFDTFTPSEKAEYVDAQTAKRLSFTWNNQYKISDVDGDSQLAITSITGAIRSRNVQQIPDWPTRGRLSYSITSVGTTRIVRWWNGTRMVAEGYRTGNGSVTCSEMNGSGISVVCSLTYSADIPSGVATVDLLWPKQYQIHYSKSTLTFPRTPEATVDDVGAISYVYLTPVLAYGTYHWNVLTVDDDGVVQTADIPTTTDKNLNDAPTAPTITGVSGTASALKVDWTVGTTGCTYTVYSSKVNQPVNFGQYTSPAPISVALDGTTATLAAITEYAAVDHTSDFSTLSTAFDNAVSAMNSAFTSGESGFQTVVNSQVVSILSAIDTFSLALSTRITPLRDEVSSSSGIFDGFISVLENQGLTTSEWQSRIGASYGAFLSTLGDLLKGTPGRYTLPNGAVGGGGDGGSALGTGSSGATAGLYRRISTTLLDVATPLIRTGKVRIIVRATKGGVQETTDNEYIVEFDDSGAIVYPRPNRVDIYSLSITSGTTLNIISHYSSIDEKTSPTHIDLYCVASGASFDFDTPQASVAVGSEAIGIRSTTLTYTAPAVGWYNVAILARSSTGSRSETYETRKIFITSSGPAAVTDLEAKVIRGRTNRKDS